jgi:signal transduction histidine kinase
MLQFLKIKIDTYMLFSQVDQRLKQEVRQEMREFEEDLAEEQPATVEQLQALFTTYLQKERVEEDQYFIAILDRQFFQSSPANLPSAVQPGSVLMSHWQTLERHTSGEASSQDPETDHVLYYAMPIVVQGQLRGAFVTAHSTTDEHREVLAAMRTVIWIKLSILLLASLVAWWVSGHVLRGLRTMTRTAQSISETDLSQRIAVNGTGEMAQLADTFNGMMDRLQSAFTNQANFVNDVSHELRTPITVIQGHLELMGDDPKEQQEVIALVNDEMERINRFISDLLLLSKADQPDFIQPEPIDLGAFMTELYQKARVLTNCDCQLDVRATGQVYLDRQRITQALLNLVSNAAQHTSANGKITLGAAIQPDELRLWVKDTGAGIAPAEQTRIFERFARSSGSQRLEGTGLGLSIVQAIVTACNGRIELDSQLQRGSTFTLVLPLRHTAKNFSLT